MLQPSSSVPPPGDDRAHEQDWREFAACRGMVTELFFPAGDVAPEPVAQAEHAKAICRHCHVRRECLAFALATNEQFGIWGGLTEDERRALRRKRRRQAS